MITAVRVVYRFVSGRALDGVVRTDATWSRSATRVLTPTGRASRWASLPGWRRQLVRLGTLPGIVAVAEGYAAAPGLAQAGAGVAGGVLAVRGARTVQQRIRTRRFRAVYVRPLARVVGPMAEIPDGTPPDRWLVISPELAGLAPRLVRPMSPAELWVRRRYAERVAPVVGYVPQRLMRARWWVRDKAAPVTGRLAWFRRPVTARPPRVELRTGAYLTQDMQAAIARAVAVKLPITDMVCSWDQVGAGATGTWTPRKRPPSFVGVDQVRAHLHLPEHEFFAGQTTDGRPVIISLDDDAPHIACSAGSGAGKSVLAALFGVQVLRRGGRVLLLDRKGSHRWALGLDGVTYCTTPADMHAALVGAASLADARNTQALSEPEGWDPGPRLFVIFEEMNSTVSALRDYWADVREQGQPKASPAIRAFREIMFMGRSARVNLFGVAQMLSANTTGGPESRENFGVRCLSRFSANAWKMLAPECPMPRASSVRGRWQIVIAGKAAEVQVAYLSPAEARAVATLSPVEQSPPKGRDLPMSPGQRPTGDTVTDPLSEALTLRQAVTAGIVPGTYDAAKKRLQRARNEKLSTAPRPVGKSGLADVYRVGDLIAWSEPVGTAGR